eukprot:scaffold259815_cov25-Tisochrysis_lutea.AAC.3
MEVGLETPFFIQNDAGMRSFCVVHAVEASQYVSCNSPTVFDPNIWCMVTMEVSSQVLLLLLLRRLSANNAVPSKCMLCAVFKIGVQASGDASPWQTQVPQEAAKRLLLHQRGLMNAQQ